MPVNLLHSYSSHTLNSTMPSIEKGVILVTITAENGKHTRPLVHTHIYMCRYISIGIHMYMVYIKSYNLAYNRIFHIPYIKILCYGYFII